MEEDSHPSEIAARQARQRAALDRAIPSVEECELFCDTLVECMVAAVCADSLRNDRSVLHPMAHRISRAARNMVVAAADYHYARAVFAAQQALDALDREEA
jgi:hypothetical protein